MSHSHSKLPTEFTQVCQHPPLPVAHSSTSGIVEQILSQILHIFITVVVTLKTIITLSFGSSLILSIARYPPPYISKSKKFSHSCTLPWAA